MRWPRRPLHWAARSSIAALLALVPALALGACGGGGASRPAAPQEGRAGTSANVGDLGNVQVPRGRAPAARSRGRNASSTPTARLVDHGPRDRRAVALTFDADMTKPKFTELQAGGGGSTWYDPRITAELERTRTPATIFLTGLWTRVHADVARRLARSPLYELENHSLSHPAFHAPCYGLPAITSESEKRTEVEASRDIIHQITGVVPRFFRFPGGCHSDADLRLVAAAGEQPLGWDVVSGDPGQPNPAALVRAVLDGVRPGSIVVMHLVGAPNAPATAAALPAIISGLRARGYRLVTLDDLLGVRSLHGTGKV